MLLFFQLNEDTVIEVWKNSPDSHTELARVTKKGYRAVISSPWYLSKIGGKEDWKTYYAYEPTNFNGKLNVCSVECIN